MGFNVPASPTLSYTRPPQGLPGDVSETPEPTLVSALCADATGLNYGLAVVTSSFQSGGTGLTTPRSVIRPVDASKKIAGFVRRVLGQPRDFGDTSDVSLNESCSLVQRGHVWLFSEVAFADPTALSDLWFIRFAASVSAPTRNVIGILRYGDNDPTGASSAATCFAVPAGMIKAIQPVLAGAVGFYDIDLTHNILTA